MLRRLAAADPDRDSRCSSSGQPPHEELNAGSVSVYSDGAVVPESGSRALVKTSMRRLRRILSNRRPVSSHVDANNIVSRGFVFGGAVFDRRQLTNPPSGSLTLSRPRVLVTILRDVQSGRRGLRDDPAAAADREPGGPEFGSNPRILLKRRAAAPRSCICKPGWDLATLTAMG